MNDDSTQHSSSTPTLTAEQPKSEHLSVTVLDSATIFEGGEVVYRYDLPGSGVVEGWALSETMEQIAKSCGAAWPDATVAIGADSSGTSVSHEAVEILSRQCAAAGARVSIESAFPQQDSTAELQPQEDPRLVEAEGQSRQAESIERTGRSSAKGIEALTRLLRQVDVFHVAIAAVVLGVVGVSWWVMGLRSSGEGAAKSPDEGALMAGESAVASQVAEALPSDSALVPDAPIVEEAAAAPDLESLRIEAEGLSVALPSGFHISVDQGLITAVGEDPDLRVLLAADPLFQVPPEVLFQELRAEIEREDTLGDPHEDGGRLSYKESPGDDSHVAWTTWTDLGHQLSVGCHTKAEPTVVQRATCRMAADSLRKLE